MLNIYNLLVLDCFIIKCKVKGYSTLNIPILSLQPTTSNILVEPIKFIYVSGLFLKINNRISTWFKYLNYVSNTTNIRSNVNSDVIGNMIQTFSLLHITMSTSMNSVESFRPLKLTPMLIFRFGSFFFFNIIGSLFHRFKFLFGSSNFSSVYFFLKLNCIYNNSGIWGKKRKVKKSKIKLYVLKSKTDSMYKDSNIFN